MTSPSDNQIDNLADRVIISYCEDDLRNHISNKTRENLKEALETPAQPHKELFDALFKALDPHEKKFAAMLKMIWEEERRIVVANIRKLKKAYRKDPEDDVNQLLFPQKEMEGRVTNGTKPLLVNVMDESGNRELAKLEVGTAFDVTNPKVQKWLNEYVPVFSKKLETVSVEKLRRELIAGLEKGESIPELMKRVNGTYANWNKVRSYDIAQNQVIRASNRSANFAYIQSGVVRKKQWLTHFDKRTCEFCAEMDGKIVSVETDFFEMGDTFTVKKRTMKIDYEDITTAPLHNRCRCSVIPIIE